MRNLNLKISVLILITGLTFSSCNKSKDPSPADNLIGTWTTGTSSVSVNVGTKTLTQYAIDVLHYSTPEAQLYATVFTELIKQGFTGTIQIKSDNTYTSNIGGEADSGTWILSSDSKKLTIDSSTEVPIIFDIVELTAKSLKLKTEQAESEDLNEDNIPELLNIKADINLTR